MLVRLNSHIKEIRVNRRQQHSFVKEFGFQDSENLKKEEVGKCIACQASSKPNPPEPLQSPPMPSHAWNEIEIDFCGPFLSGHFVLVVIDVYSHYTEIEILKSTAAPKVIPKLDITFARHGIPEKVTTDNGPPFNGNEINFHLTSI